MNQNEDISTKFDIILFQRMVCVLTTLVWKQPQPVQLKYYVKRHKNYCTFYKVYKTVRETLIISCHKEIRQLIDSLTKILKLYHLSCTYIVFKGELHSNYIFLHFSLISLEWDSITLFTKMNFVFLPKLTFQHHLHNIYLFINMNIF